MEVQQGEGRGMEWYGEGNKDDHPNIVVLAICFYFNDDYNYFKCDPCVMSNPSKPWVDNGHLKVGIQWVFLDQMW